jgi:hypothetical protein
MLNSWQPAQGSAGAISIDSEDHVYLKIGGKGEGGLAKFGPSGTLLGVNIVEYAEFFGPETITPAVDPATDDLYVGIESQQEAVQSQNFVYRYDSTCHPRVGRPVEEDVSCKPVETIGKGLVGSRISGLGIDAGSPAHTLFVAEVGRQAGTAQVLAFSEETVPDVTTTKPLNPTASSATLTGTINPGGIELNPGIEGCRFEWGLTAAPYEHQAPCDKSAAQIGAGSSPVEVRANITGLQAGHTYHYRLVASNPNDENPSVHQPSLGADLAFGPPLIESASTLDVSATEAELQAEVNPQNLDTGARIEYVTQAQFQESGFAAALATVPSDLGSAGTVQKGSFHISGLQPRTAYRYRVIAENALAQGTEAVSGPEPPPAFTTEGAAPSGLPEARHYELVSPPDKLSASILPIYAGLSSVQAAADGRAITYLTSAPIEPQPQGAGANHTRVLSTRASSGWLSQDLDTPQLGRTDTVAPDEYRAFSEDLAYGFLNPYGLDPAISPEASEVSAFRRADYVGADPAQQCLAATMHCYRPLATGADGIANVPPGTLFGSANNEGTSGPSFLSSTPDGAHAIVASRVALTETALPVGQVGLYEWSAEEPPASQLQLVNLLPGSGQPANSAILGVEHGSPNRRNALSADGTRVVFSERGGADRLFLRDTARGETIQLDLHEPGCSKCESGGGEFQLASRDGSRVLFTDSKRLTSDSGIADLYRCQIVESEVTGQLECALTDLTPKTGSGESADVQGLVIGASADASSVYFSANGALTEEPNDLGEVAHPGTCDITGAGGACSLYLSREGHLAFIATLSGADRTRLTTELTAMPGRVSPDGQWLAFMAASPLAGYDNRDRSSGEPVAEVYLYHAPSGGQGTLLCPSCEPSGARPRGVLLPSESSTIANYGLGFDTPVAANLPGWMGPHQPRYLSDSGRLFFTTVDPLLPSDANGTQDVYEYEPTGVGDCSEAQPGFSPSSDGCLGLISSGTSAKESAFVDASESGDDVFILTSDRLAPTDVDSAGDIYDAHVCSSEVPCLPPPETPKPPCEGDGCQQPAAPPVDPTPGSLTFQGAGNVTECPKGKVLKGGKCVTTKHKAKKHHKKKGHKKQKRANSNRGVHK